MLRQGVEILVTIRPDKSTENGATVVVPVRLEDHKGINGTYTTISSCYTKEHKGKPKTNGS